MFLKQKTKRRNLILGVFVFLMFSACFGSVDKRGSVTGYSNGTVITEGGSFLIGQLPSTWVRKKFSYRALLFQSPNGSSISVNSFCKGSFDDGPLPLLSRQLLYGLGNQKTHSQKTFKLDGRDAIRTVVDGAMDGAQVTVDAVTLKMNECIFDFVYTSTPHDYSAGVSDFEGLYKGFKYLHGPKID